MKNWFLRRFGPRCGAAGPWRLIDCGTCIIYRGHEHDGYDKADWHADATGFIWNETRWQWMGPVIGPEEYGVSRWGEYRDPPGDTYAAVFTEDPWPGDPV